MQAFVFNRVVTEPKERLPQANFSVPHAVQKALNEGLWNRIDQKQKWAVYVAAILAFYHLSDEEQYAAMDVVTAARRRNDFRHLLQRKEKPRPNGIPAPRIKPRRARRTANGVEFQE